MWWNRPKNKTVPSPTESEAAGINPANQTNQPPVEEDAVLLPPGASTDDGAMEDGDTTEPDTNAANHNTAGAKTEGTTPVSASTTTPATPAQTPAASTPAPDTAVTPAAPAASASEQHPVLSAALKDGIDTDAKYAALSAEAAEGRAALTAGRTEAKAAATARYGTEQPEKLQAAEAMIAATNSVAQLSMLTDTFLAGAPGANTPRNGDGSGKRVSASQAPPTNATTEKTGTSAKPGAGASNGGAKPDPYAQYNSQK